MYTYHALINALSAHMIHINLNMIFYTHVQHSPIKNNLHILTINDELFCQFEGLTLVVNLRVVNQRAQVLKQHLRSLLRVGGRVESNQHVWSHLKLLFSSKTNKI